MIGKKGVVEVRMVVAEPRVIHSKEEYDTALQIVRDLMMKDISEDSDEFKLLETWSILIEEYEDEKYPTVMPDPISAIKFRMEQMGLKRKDLEQYIGSSGRISEVLNGKRPLTLDMMRKLHDGLGIPAEVLIQPQKEASA